MLRFHVSQQEVGEKFNNQKDRQTDKQTDGQSNIFIYNIHTVSKGMSYFCYQDIQFSEYLRTLSLKFQKARTKI